MPILMSKPLDNLTPNHQRMKYTIKFTPGNLSLQSLSWIPLPGLEKEELSGEITAYVQIVIEKFPLSDASLDDIGSLC